MKLDFKALSVATLALSALTMSSCGPEKTVEVTAIEITSTPSPLVLAVDGTGKVEASVVPSDVSDKSVEWSVDPEGVVEVAADGTVTALALGEAVITATAGNDITEECPVVVNYEFTGTFSVAPGTPMEFTIDNVVVAFALGVDVNTADIEMRRVSFAERMPLMDITVPGVTLTEQDGEYLLSCGDEGIVPIMAGGEFPDRMITEIAGSADQGNMSFSFVCMGLPVSFEGTLDN